MDDGQFLIKAILILAFAVFALLLLLPERGSRRTAIRRIVLLLAFVAVALGVVFPGVVDQLAKLIGVGRGADLLLYVLFIMFVAQSIAASRRNRVMERQITALARRAAIDREATRIASEDDAAR